MGAMHGSSSGFLSVEMPNTFSMSWEYVKKYIKEKELNVRNVMLSRSSKRESNDA